MTTPLRDAVQAHVESRALTADQFAALDALADPPVQNRRWIRRLVLAAALALGVGLSSWWAQRVPLVDRIASEVVQNHRRLKPLEIKGAQLAALQPFFADLNVDLVPGALPDQDWQLIGGRHCSVQGTDAAQLRLRDAGGRFGSVYVAPYSASSFGGLPSAADARLAIVDGVRVRLWVESDMVVVQVLP